MVVDERIDVGLDTLSRVGTAMADGVRRQILVQLTDGPRYPAELADALGESRANISNHLACLRGCGLVRATREGRQIRYDLASRKLAFLVHHAVTFGLIYGALVYLFMHLVVLPLSAVPHRDMPLIYKACEFVEHWFCVGLPIALSVRHYSR